MPVVSTNQVQISYLQQNLPPELANFFSEQALLEILAERGKAYYYFDNIELSRRFQNIEGMRKVFESIQRDWEGIVNIQLDVLDGCDVWLILQLTTSQPPNT